TVRSQTTITNKQNADATAGIVANALLQVEYTEATDLLNADQALTVSDSPSDGNWSTTQTNQFSINNANYQNDAAVSQTGETNASTAVQQLQTAVSTDSTNLSNLVSLAQTLIQIGGYTANLINNAYT
ncbi:MAG: hypothetical protein JSS09_09325, partial [Verrucomicrobia bacterium]|nr:hypothetical protein [Verrucomicrobiota bacterium]